MTNSSNLLSEINLKFQNNKNFKNDKFKKPILLYNKFVLKNIYNNIEPLYQSGEVVYGYIVNYENAVSSLKIRNKVYLADIIFSTDEYFKQFPEDLRQISDNLMEYLESENDGKDEDLIYHLEKELTCSEMIQLPFSLTNNKVVYLSTSLLYANHIPKKSINTRLIPIICNPNSISSIAVLSKNYWNDDYIQKYLNSTEMYSKTKMVMKRGYLTGLLVALFFVFCFISLFLFISYRHNETLLSQTAIDFHDLKISDLPNVENEKLVSGEIFLLTIKYATEVGESSFDGNSIKSVDEYSYYLFPVFKYDNNDESYIDYFMTLKCDNSNEEQYDSILDIYIQSMYYDDLPKTHVIKQGVIHKIDDELYSLVIKFLYDDNTEDGQSFMDFLIEVNTFNTSDEKLIETKFVPYMIYEEEIKKASFFPIAIFMILSLFMIIGLVLNIIKLNKDKHIIAKDLNLNS